MGYYITRKAWEDPDKRAAAVDFVSYMTSDELVPVFAQHTASALKNAPAVDESQFNALQIEAMDMMSGSFLIPEKNLLKSMFLYFPQNVKMNFILYLNRFMILSLMTNVSKVILQLIYLKQIWIK